MLGAWLGWQVALTAAGLSGAAWLALRVARDRSRPLGLGLLLAAVVAAFVAHKLNVDHAAFGRGPSAGRAAHVLGLLVAVSFSYVALRVVDLAVGVLHRGQPLQDPLSCAGFLTPFHMLLSGPVNRWEEHAAADVAEAPGPTPERLVAGLDLVATGLVYKYVVAEHLRRFWFGEAPLDVAAWVDTAYLLVYTFFDFAGYSCVALGVGRLLGVPTPENFRAPFLAPTATEFFTRWHASLGGFVQRTIYTPLQLTLVRRFGVKRAVWAGLLALATSWLFVGLWHRLSLRFLAYGLLMAAWIWLEKLVRDRSIKAGWQKKTWATRAVHVVGPVYVFVVLTTMLHLVSREIWTR